MSLIVSGCAPETKVVEGVGRGGTKINGSVFIVTKAALNIKLALVSIYAMPESDFLTYSNSAQSGINSRARAFGEAMFEKKTNFNSARLYRIAADHFLSQLPAPKTKTDEDGKFFLTIDGNGPIVLVAEARRELVGEDGETYFWMHKIILSGKEERVLLSNDNMQEAVISSA